MEVTKPNSDTICINQAKYIDDCLVRYSLTTSNMKASAFPLQPSFQITKGGRPAEGTPAFEELIKLPYAQLVGSLMWIQRGTRSDITHAVSVLSQYNTCYTMEHWKALRGVLKYLANTKHLGLVFKKQKTGTLKLVAYNDSDWGSDMTDRKSQSGGLFFFGECPIDWYSHKQRFLSLSSTESEFYALCKAGREVIFLKAILDFLEHRHNTVVLYGDNQGSLRLAENPVSSEKTRHIRELFIRDLVKDKEVKVLKIATAVNPAHVMASKVYTDSASFYKLREMLIQLITKN